MLLFFSFIGLIIRCCYLLSIVILSRHLYSVVVIIMANVEKRISKEGKITYRVKVRLKGFPTQQATFERLTDARVNQHPKGTTLSAC